MKIGVITNGISNDYETSCRIMRETGVAYAEIQHVDNLPVENLTTSDALRWKEISKRYDVVPMCITTHAFVGIPVADIEVNDELYRQHLALLRNAIRMAKILGVDMVRTMTFAKTIVTFGAHGAEQWLAGQNRSWPKFIQLFRPLAAMAEDEGITLLIETCFNSMNTSASLSKRMIEEVGSPNLKLLWDMANAMYYHEYPTVALYESIKGVLGHIHVKDVKLDTVNSTVDFCPLGTGDLAPYLADLARALRGDEYQGYISLENVYKPDGGDFVDGYRMDMPVLQSIFQDALPMSGKCGIAENPR